MTNQNDEILEAASRLGTLIAGHPASVRYHDLVTRIKDDTEAQRLLNDYARVAETIAQKEANKQPIEVAEKHQLADLQSQVAMHPLLRDLQIAQMDHLDLMRKVEQAISGAADSGSP